MTRVPVIGRAFVTARAERASGIRGLRRDRDAGLRVAAANGMQLRDAVSPEPDYPFLKRVAMVMGSLTAGILFMGTLCLLTRTQKDHAMQIATIEMPKLSGVGMTLPAEATPEQLALAKVELDGFAFEAYPRWAAGGRDCPQRLLDVNRFAPHLHAVDPWGTPYQFLCGRHYAGFTTRSAGPDRMFDTADDINAGR